MSQHGPLRRNSAHFEAAYSVLGKLEQLSRSHFRTTGKICSGLLNVAGLVQFHSSLGLRRGTLVGPNGEQQYAGEKQPAAGDGKGHWQTHLPIAQISADIDHSTADCNSHQIEVL